MAELIDVYNANLEPQGVEDRKEAHLQGRWHQTFHLWLVSRKSRSLLFQLRAPHVINYPSMLDITAAGHLKAGESVESGLREVKEELGIDLQMGDIHGLGYRVEVADQDNGQKNREYQAVFLAETELKTVDLRPDPAEVYGIIGIPISDCYALFTKSTGRVHGLGIAYEETSGDWQEISREIGLNDFIPRIQQYYLTVAIMAERLLEGKSPLSIS